MRKQSLLVFCIAISASVLLSGCTDNGQQSKLEYKDDIITIEEYYVSDITPYVDSIVSIDFLVQNNGEEAVPRVQVSFKIPGFQIEEGSLKCGGGRIGSDGESCIFDDSGEYGEIEPLDVRSVSVKLRTPQEGSIIKPASFTISYYIEYDYGGFRKMDIPVIDGGLVTEPTSKYSQSTPTYGPIKLEFKTPERGERVIEGKTVKEYWGVSGSSFRVEMELKNIGSGDMKDESPEIKAGDMTLDLKNVLERAYKDTSEGRKPLPCDFCAPGEIGCVGTEQGYLYLKEAVEVPDDLSCEFQSLPFEGGEIVATIWADFVYTYEYSMPQDIEVRPIK